ncbi:DUF1801 domain-containing protein [Hyphobacterium sp.]|uniref:DUF1801 domain-containing protein n=1 Tax=Hyphobacterium sp. TaxID=2004662 RepID=UPI003BAB6CD4
MSENKTKPTAITPADFIASVEHDGRREDAKTLLDLFERMTGWKAKMWGPSIIGFGEYHYKYDSGREGDFLATGFSPRKANLSIYIMPGYQDYEGILARLGKHKHGKSCLYVNKLADIDLDVLEELVKAGLDDLSKKYPVKPS